METSPSKPSAQDVVEKAIKLTMPECRSGPDLEKELATLKTRAEPKLFFTCVGRISEFPDDFIDAAAPFYEINGQTRMKLPCHVVFDDYLNKEVTLWQSAIRRMWQMDVETLESMWEACASEDGKGKLMALLNSVSGKQFVFIGTASLWREHIQLNINDVEAVTVSAM